MKLGDAVSAVATPIAGALGLDCYDPVTRDLRPTSPCAQRRNALNNFSDSFYDRFWKKPTRKENSMPEDAKSEPEQVEFILSISITAVDIVDAINRRQDWRVLAVNPRPKPQPMPVQPTIGPGGPQTVLHPTQVRR